MADNVLRFDFTARDRASSTFDTVGKHSDGLASKIGKFGKFAAGALVKTGTAMGALAVAGAALGVKTAASLEQAQIGFATLLHSGQKAQVFLKGLTAFAAATPFELKGLIDSSRTLIGVGLNTKQTMKALQDFGDTASAVGIGQDSFQRIMLATSQAISAGKFMTADLNQIANNGIPVWVILSKSMHKTVPELRDLASHGKLLAKDVLPTLERQMHKDYGGAMAKQSMTLNGLWSTFTDTLSLGLAKAITPMIPALKVGLAGASTIASKALAQLPGILDKATAAFKTTRDFLMNHVVPEFQTAFDFVAKHTPHIDLSGIKNQFRTQSKTWGGVMVNGIKTAGIGKSLETQAGTWGTSLIAGIQTGLHTGNWKALGSVLGEGLTNAITAGASGAGKLAGAIGKWFTGIDWELVGESAGKTAFPFIIGFSATLVDGLIDVAKKHPLNTALFIISLIPLGKFAAAFGPLRDAIEHLPLGKAFTALLDKTAVPVFDAVWTFMKFLGRRFVAGFEEAGIVTEGAVGTFIRSIGKGISDRASYLATRTEEFIGGIAQGVGRMARNIAFTMRQVIGWETKPFVNAGTWLFRSGMDLIRGSIRGLQAMDGAVASGVRTAIRWLTRPFATSGRWLFQAGRSLLAGIRDGMINGVQGAGAWAANVGGKIVRAVKRFFGIASPSKVMWGVGRNLIQSLFGAMIDHNPKQAITKIFGGMPQALGALVDKGLVHITSLPGKAMKALTGLGGKFASLFGGGSGSGIAIGGASAAEQWIINHESGGRTTAQNPTSTAFGLGQLILANRIAYGARLGVSPFTTNPMAQLSMMRMYIHDRYGTAENAKAFWMQHHWYGAGGMVNSPRLIGAGDGGPERVLSPRQTQDFSQLVQVLDRGSSPAQTGSPSIDYAKLGRALATALSGTTVQLDGKAVGSVQGRDSNLKRRAG